MVVDAASAFCNVKYWFEINPHTGKCMCGGIYPKYCRMNTHTRYQLVNVENGCIRNIFLLLRIVLYRRPSRMPIIHVALVESRIQNVSWLTCRKIALNGVERPWPFRQNVDAGLFPLLPCYLPHQGASVKDSQHGKIEGFLLCGVHYFFRPTSTNMPFVLPLLYT